MVSDAARTERPTFGRRPSTAIRGGCSRQLVTAMTSGSSRWSRGTPGAAARADAADRGISVPICPCPWVRSLPAGRPGLNEL